jgi:hypothetical protein
MQGMGLLATSKEGVARYAPTRASNIESQDAVSVMPVFIDSTATGTNTP